MNKKQYVIDASPIICFSKAKLEFILEKLFSEILIPESVYNEILNGPKDDRAIKVVKSSSWLKVVKVEKVNNEIAIWNLGKGETEVLTMAYENRSFKAIIDDAAARKCSKVLGIPFMGSGGILVLAKKRGIISSVDEALNALKVSGLWLSKDIEQIIKKKAGES